VDLVTMSSLAYLPQYVLDALMSSPHDVRIQLRYFEIDTTREEAEAGALCPVILPVDDDSLILPCIHPACINGLTHSLLPSFTHAMIILPLVIWPLRLLCPADVPCQVDFSMLDATVATLAAHMSRLPQKPLVLTLTLSSWMDSDPHDHGLRSQRFLQLFQHLARLDTLKIKTLCLHGYHLVLGREEVHALGRALGRSVEVMVEDSWIQWRGYSSDQELRMDLKAAFPSLLLYGKFGQQAVALDGLGGV
jgi:hypothetical protein